MLPVRTLATWITLVVMLSSCTLFFPMCCTHLVVVASFPIPKPPGSLCSDPVDMVKFKAIFYSPSIIGEDTHVSKIDLYTEYFANQHKVLFKMRR